MEPGVQLTVDILLVGLSVFAPTHNYFVVHICREVAIDLVQVFSADPPLFARAEEPIPSWALEDTVQRNSQHTHVHSSSHPNHAWGQPIPTPSNVQQHSIPTASAQVL